MSDFNMTEKEQIEQLKRLWKEYGWATLAGVLIAMAIVFGWRYYQQYKTQKAEQASVVYAHMMIAQMNSQPKEVLKQVKTLRQEFSSTPFATLAALTGAKVAVDNEKFSDAQQQFQWVIDHGKGDAFQEIARIRLARLYLAQQKPKEAIRVLSSVDDNAFLALIAQVRGDAYVQLKQIDNARSAYKASLSVLPKQALIRPLIEMKLEALPALKQSS